jgi:hypothetical protein
MTWFWSAKRPSTCCSPSNQLRCLASFNNGHLISSKLNLGQSSQLFLRKLRIHIDSDMVDYCSSETLEMAECQESSRNSSTQCWDWPRSWATPWSCRHRASHDRRKGLSSNMGHRPFCQDRFGYWRQARWTTNIQQLDSQDSLPMACCFASTKLSTPKICDPDLVEYLELLSAILSNSWSSKAVECQWACRPELPTSISY